MSAAHCPGTFLCAQSNSWQQLIFLAAAFFSKPAIVCTDVQSAVIHLKCYSACITSLGRTFTLSLQCCLNSTHFWGAVVVGKAKDRFVKSFECFLFAL